MARNAAMRRLLKEIQTLTSTPQDGFRVTADDNDMTDLTCWLEGPAGTPYEGGRFKIQMVFGENFPQQPPHCVFHTKIFHSNVGPKGEICVNILKKDWSPTYGVEHILLTIRSLLIYPNAESALNEEAGKLLLENYTDFAARARLMTSIHAQSGPVIQKTAESPNKESLRTQRTQLAPLGPSSNMDKAAPEDVTMTETKPVAKASAGPAPKRKTLRRL